jgi:four helix bundle protein
MTANRTKAPRYSYRNLALWQEAQDFGQDIAALVETLPPNRSSQVLGTQLLRAATSIAANIAEGHGRFSPAAYRNHLSIAKGSACEADSWLDLLRRLGQIDAQTEAALHERCNVLIAALTNRMKALEQRGVQRIREEKERYLAGPDE